MPMLHDRTRRFVCLLLFLSLGVMPPAVALSIGLWHKFAFEESEEQRLSAALGVDIRIEDRAKRSRPGVTTYRDLRWHDAETGALVLSTPTMTVTREPSQTSGADEPNAPFVWELSATKCEMNIASSAAVTSLMAHIIEQRTPWDVGGIDLHISQLVLATADETRPKGLPEWLGSVRLQSTWNDDRIDATLSFCLPPTDGSNETSSPISVHMTRMRGEGGATTQWQIHAPAPMPIALAQMLVPGFDWPICRTATFQGTLRAHREAGGWSGRISGRINGLVLLHEPPGYPRRSLKVAEASLTIDEGRFSESRLETAEGRFEMRQGWIGAELLDDWVRQLGLNLSPTVDTNIDALPFTTCQADYRLANGQFQLGASKADSMIMTNSSGGILAMPGNVSLTISPTTLIADLIPTSEQGLAYSTHLVRLLDRLPRPKNEGNATSATPVAAPSHNARATPPAETPAPGYLPRSASSPYPAMQPPYPSTGNPAPRAAFHEGY